LVLTVLALVIGGYAYFYESTRDTTAVETKEKAFGTVTSDDVEEITIKSADGETSKLQKEADKWTLVEPVKAPADAGELSTITGALATLDVQRVVDEKPSDLKPFGLDPARLEIAFRKKGDQAVHRVLIGDKTPTGGELYAKLPDAPRVFLVSSYLDSTLNKNTFALRDKRVLTFERDKVDGLEIASGPTVMQFAKTGSEWKMVKPVQARADYAAVEGAVERLSSVQMQSIVEPEAASLAKYGLNAPTTTLTAVMGSARSTLTLGGTDNALVFARDSARPMVFTVAPTVKTDVVKEAADYRRKDLFDSRSFTTDKVEIVRGADTLVLEKTKDKDGKDVWKTGSGTTVETSKAEDILTKLTNLRAVTFEATPNAVLKMPVLKVTVTFDQKKMETVTVGRMGTVVAASRADEPGSATVDATPVDEVLKALEGVK
jgi:uncharacterized surface protein with fasciclin (FAS1) repeats